MEEGTRILKMATASRAQFIPNPKSRLFDQVREVLRFHHYSFRTEKTYAHWIRRFLVFHRRLPEKTFNIQHLTSNLERDGWRHPKDMGAAEVSAYLSHLAVAGNVAAATQRQAFCVVEG